MREFFLECLIVDLEHALDHAVKSGFDSHFISEIKHLIATAEANR